MNKPDFIPENIWHRYLKPVELKKYFLIDRCQPSSYIAKMSHTSNPVAFTEIESESHSHTHYKAYLVEHVVSHATRSGLLVESVSIIGDTYSSLKQKLRELEEGISITEAIIENKERLLIEKENRLKEHEILHELSKELDSQLPSYERIIKESANYKLSFGVYFLVKESEIVYIGQSVNIASRIATHYSEGRIEFDRYCYVPCDRSNLNAIESLYIHMFKPVMNGRGTEATMRNNIDYISAPMTRDAVYEQIVDTTRRFKKYA